MKKQVLFSKITLREITPWVWVVLIMGCQSQQESKLLQNTAIAVTSIPQVVPADLPLLPETSIENAPITTESTISLPSTPEPSFTWESPDNCYSMRQIVSPDSRWVIYLCGSKNEETWIEPFDKSLAPVLLLGAGDYGEVKNFAWSPDSQKFLIFGDSENPILLFYIDRLNAPITLHEKPAGAITYADWSPNSQMAIIRVRGEATFSLLEMDGSITTLLSENKTSSLLDWTVTSQWMPDNQHIIYPLPLHADPTLNTEHLTQEFWQLDVKSGQRELLLEIPQYFMGADWSADKQQMIYGVSPTNWNINDSAYNPTSYLELWKFDLGSHASTLMTTIEFTKTGGLPLHNPDWSPDGRFVALEAVNDVYLFSMETGELIKVYQGKPSEVLTAPTTLWSHNSEYLLVQELEDIWRVSISFMETELLKCGAFLRYSENWLQNGHWVLIGLLDYKLGVVDIQNITLGERCE